MNGSSSRKVPRSGRVAGLRCRWSILAGRQLLEEARRHAGRPLIVDAPVGGEADGQPARAPGSGRHRPAGAPPRAPGRRLRRARAGWGTGPPPSPARNTVSNSSPLAPCSGHDADHVGVRRRSALSITRLTCSRNAGRVSNSCSALTSSFRFSSRPGASGVRRPATSRCSPTRRAPSRPARVALRSGSGAPAVESGRAAPQRIAWRAPAARRSRAHGRAASNRLTSPRAGRRPQRAHACCRRCRGAAVLTMRSKARSSSG